MVFKVLKIVRDVIFLVTTMLPLVLVVKQTYGAQVEFDVFPYTIGAVVILYLLSRFLYVLATAGGAIWLTVLWAKEYTQNIPVDFRMFSLNPVFIFLAGWIFYLITQSRKAYVEVESADESDSQEEQKH
jgi:hypothetical protein